MRDKTPKRIILTLALAGVLLGAYNFARNLHVDNSPRIDIVLGGPGKFHEIVGMGAKEAAERYKAVLRVHTPDGSYRGQTDALLEISPDKTDGIAVSPMSPGEQTQLLSDYASKVNLITFDNDSPDSLRLCYVGTDNFNAGFMCGELVKSALPEGGKVAVFVADLERNNARLRIQGVLAALSGTVAVQREDILDKQVITLGTYTVVGPYLDGFDRGKAVQNALKALSEHPDLQAMVGLYSYNAPMIMKALIESEQLGNVKLIAFDDLEETLNAIADGNIMGTVVQDHYQYGYESVRLLADLYRRNENAVPRAGKGTFHLPCSIVTKSNIEEYRTGFSNRSR